MPPPLSYPPLRGDADNTLKELGEARVKLEERGEKLRQLGDRAAGLEDAAAGFAAMAKQLKEQQQQQQRGKWW